jgi:hypothetical protein
MLQEIDKQVLKAIDDLFDSYQYGIPARVLADKVNDIISERRLELVLRELKKDKWIDFAEGTAGSQSISGGIYSIKLLKLVR